MRLKRSDTAFGFENLGIPLERYSRQPESFRVAEQLRATRLKMAETVANDVSSSRRISNGCHFIAAP
jgi:hypothetical protein